jgi:hypothetical protein
MRVLTVVAPEFGSSDEYHRGTREVAVDLPTIARPEQENSPDGPGGR